MRTWIQGEGIWLGKCVVTGVGWEVVVCWMGFLGRG